MILNLVSENTNLINKYMEIPYLLDLGENGELGELIINYYEELAINAEIDDQNAKLKEYYKSKTYLDDKSINKLYYSKCIIKINDAARKLKAYCEKNNVNVEKLYLFLDDFNLKVEKILNLYSELRYLDLKKLKEYCL